jgi:hypothetical protein
MQGGGHGTALWGRGPGAWGNEGWVGDRIIKIAFLVTCQQAERRALWGDRIDDSYKFAPGCPAALRPGRPRHLHPPVPIASDVSSCTSWPGYVDPGTESWSSAPGSWRDRRSVAPGGGDGMRIPVTAFYRPPSPSRVHQDTVPPSRPRRRLVVDMLAGVRGPWDGDVGLHPGGRGVNVGRLAPGGGRGTRIPDKTANLAVDVAPTSRPDRVVRLVVDMLAGVRGHWDGVVGLRTGRRGVNVGR